MSASNYEVYVNTTPIADNPDKSPDDDTRFQVLLTSIEIKPPISRPLANILRTALCHKMATDMGIDIQTLYEKGFSTSATEFCDEGASVNTLVTITGTEYGFGFDGSKDEIEGNKADYSRTVEQILSPSGKAIAKKQ